jgi:hypothetical protein
MAVSFVLLISSQKIVFNQKKAVSKGPSRLVSLLFLKTEADPASESQCCIETRWTKAKDRSLQ